MVGVAAGEEVARSIAFDTVEAGLGQGHARRPGAGPGRAGSSCTAGMIARAVTPNKLGVEIEAALAFGTGHHGTTRGCLLLLDAVLKERYPRRVLDLGTGTGVLAIAAAKALSARSRQRHRSGLGEGRRDNARLNGTGDLVQVIRATGFEAPQFASKAQPRPTWCWRISAGRCRCGVVRPDRAASGTMSALVILSGLLTPQAAGVIAAYRARGLVPLRHIRIDGWSSLLLRNAG